MGFPNHRRSRSRLETDSGIHTKPAAIFTCDLVHRGTRVDPRWICSTHRRMAACGPADSGIAYDRQRGNGLVTDLRTARFELEEIELALGRCPFPNAAEYNHKPESGPARLMSARSTYPIAQALIGFISTGL